LGKLYSADLNGSLNILRKVVGESIFDRNSVERLVVSPKFGVSSLPSWKYLTIFLVTINR
jgi:transposase